MRRGASLTMSIFSFFLPMVILTVFFLSFSIAVGLRPAVHDYTTIMLRENANFLRDLTAPLWAEDRSRVLSQAFTGSEHASIRIALYDSQGTLLSSSNSPSAASSSWRQGGARIVAQALEGKEGQLLTSPQGGREQRLHVAVPVYSPSGNELLGAIELSTSLEHISNGFDRGYRYIFYFGLGMLLLSFLSSCMLSRTLQAPLNTLRHAARRYGELDFQHRPYIDGPPELEKVAEIMGASMDAVNGYVQRLIHEKEELQTVFRGMVEGVIVLDAQLTIRDLNPAVAQLLSIPTDNSRGKSLIAVTRHSELYDLAKQALREESLVERTVQLPLSGAGSGEAPRLTSSTRMRSYMHLRIHAVCISTDLLEQGVRHRQKRVVLVMNDITRLKNLERMREDFVSNVSHELKTPITSIKGFTETLREGAAEDPDTARRFIDIIHHHTERLETIIEDLFSLSRLEREDENIVEKELLSAGTVAERAALSCRAQATEKGITIHTDCGDDIGLYANASLLEQALLNLVDNAVKYCSSGDVVTVSCSGDEAAVVFRVEDDGPGIPSKELDRIFERFYRVDKTRSRRLGGTGLGLAIVKHIAIAHGGTVDVESTVGVGTAFIVTLPRTPKS